MLIKIYLAACFLLIFSNLPAQEKIILNDKEGIFVSCELIKIESKGKKDKYLATVKAENKNDYDVYYAVPLANAANGNSSVSILATKQFAQCSVRNSTGIFGDNINLVGQETRLSTADNKLLFTIAKGSFITADKEFRVKAGIKPIITNSFLINLARIDNFEIAINEAIINGEWVSNCGNNTMNLVLQKNFSNETVIKQLINGKENIWLKINPSTFKKQVDSTTTITFNRATNNFSYATNDGANCIWSKK